MNQVKEVCAEEWDKFVESSEQGTIFSTSKWMRLYDAKYKFMGYYKGNNLLGGAVICEPLPITQFQGILIAPVGGKYTTTMSLHQEVANALMPYLSDEFACSPFFPDIRPFLWAGWQASVRYTYILNPDWNEVEKDTRWEIKNSKVEVKESTDIQFFDSLYEYTFQHKGLKRTASQELLDRLSHSIPYKMYVSSDNSSAVILIFDSKRAYYILGASTASDTSSCVLWNSVKDLKEVDLIGCNNKFIDRFKRQFGGRLFPYYSIKKI